MNLDTLTPPPLFVKWLSSNAVQRDSTHSSIRIGFSTAEQARLAVEQKIFYSRYNKRTEHGRKTKPRCMNCLKEGHITKYCTEAVMCPYCAGDHVAETCDLHGKIPSNCTACARHAKRLDPSTDLQQLFSETPRHLRHSPLDPTCPAMIASKLQTPAAPHQGQSQTPPPLTETSRAATGPGQVRAADEATRPSANQPAHTQAAAEDINMSQSC